MSQNCSFQQNVLGILTIHISFHIVSRLGEQNRYLLENVNIIGNGNWFDLTEP